MNDMFMTKCTITKEKLKVVYAPLIAYFENAKNSSSKKGQKIIQNARADQTETKKNSQNEMV